ncbi:MAG TPA: hypothetical protein VMD59_21790 [Acidimicrobiales bacterium]|nr:hypothetical protein [Acidimicrobiales bacterium]
MTEDPIDRPLSDSVEFDAVEIARSPEAPGAYTLLSGRSAIFIGMSDDIRGALVSHRDGEQGTLTGHATDYWCAPSTIPEATMCWRQMSETYRTSHNLNLPPGNRAGLSRALSAVRPEADRGNQERAS